MTMFGRALQFLSTYIFVMFQLDHHVFELMQLPLVQQTQQTISDKYDCLNGHLETDNAVAQQGSSRQLKELNRYGTNFCLGHKTFHRLGSNV